MSAPKPPDPNQVAQTQFGYNKQAQQAGMIGQQTPYGSLAWNVDPSQPGGFTAKQTLSPQELALLNLQITGQTGAGTAAAGLGGQLAGLYGQPPNLDPATMTKQLMDWQTQYMQPYWDTQKSNLEAQLQNQGLTPGSEAFTNAQRGFTEGVGGARNQFFAQAEPLAFSQELQKYQLPLQTEQSLLGMGTPQGPSFVPTPSVQPPDYQQAAMQQYAAKQQQYGNMMQGLFGIPTALAGGWAKGGFPGLSGLGGLGAGVDSGAAAAAGMGDAAGMASLLADLGPLAMV